MDLSSFDPNNLPPELLAFINQKVKEGVKEATQNSNRVPREAHITFSRFFYERLKLEEEIAQIDTQIAEIQDLYGDLVPLPESELEEVILPKEKTGDGKRTRTVRPESYWEETRNKVLAVLQNQTQPIKISEIARLAGIPQTEATNLHVIKKLKASGKVIQHFEKIKTAYTLAGKEEKIEDAEVKKPSRSKK